MAGKEGTIDRGLETWQKVNKITFALAAGAWLAGEALTVPFLIGFGKAGVIFDGLQMVAIKGVQEAKKRATPTKK